MLGQAIARRLKGQREVVSAHGKALFVLSTGRAGSLSCSRLLKLCPEVDAWCEPLDSDILYLHAIAHRCGHDEQIQAALKRGYQAARGSKVQSAWSRNLVYADTSYDQTFLAPQIAELFPNARFLHLVRNPSDVIYSGLRRGWYEGHPNDPFRVKPTEGDPIFDQWGALSNFEKACWGWNRTNTWIADFIDSRPEGTCATLNSEDLFKANPESLKTLFSMVDQAVPRAEMIEMVLKSKYGQQKKSTNDTEAEQLWAGRDRNRMDEILGNTARKYGYEI